jgi:hypothetical protein
MNTGSSLSPSCVVATLQMCVLFCDEHTALAVVWCEKACRDRITRNPPNFLTVSFSDALCELGPFKYKNSCNLFVATRYGPNFWFLPIRGLHLTKYFCSESLEVICEIEHYAYYSEVVIYSVNPRCNGLTGIVDVRYNRDEMVFVKVRHRIHSQYTQ